MKVLMAMLVSLLALLAMPAQAQTQTISVCADPDPPPWTYWMRDADNKKTTVFVGSSVDTFKSVFERLGMSVSFIGNLPWARCLKMVQEGKIDFAMDAYYDSERAKVFAFTRHYNTLTPQVFYRKQKPVNIASRNDLKRYKGCGMIGASYAHYGLLPDQLDLGVNTYEGMITKLKAGRCDYFVEELEVIAGYKKLGRDFLNDPDMQHAAVPDAVAPAKHLIAVRGGRAEKLLPKIDEILEGMAQSGELGRIWKKHAPDTAFKP